jgi:type II secretory pathway pseudopilin PulG
MTNYSHLLKDRRIRREPAARGQVNQQLAAARRDLETARWLLTDKNEWACVSSPSFPSWRRSQRTWTLTQPNFINAFTVSSILTGAAYVAIVGVGMTVVIVGGQIDISVGSMIGVCALVFSCGCTHPRELLPG